MSELITIARPYAKALFEVSEAKKALVAWRQSLGQIAVIAENADVQLLMINPKINQTDRVNCFTKLIDDLPQDIMVFLQILAKEGRLSVMPQIYKLFADLCDASQQIIQAELISAKPVSVVFLERLEKNISERYQAKVLISAKIDKSLIGGGVLRVGDDVIDVSLRTKLQKIATEMLG